MSPAEGAFVRPRLCVPPSRSDDARRRCCELALHCGSRFDLPTPDDDVATFRIRLQLQIARTNDFASTLRRRGEFGGRAPNSEAAPVGPGRSRDLLRLAVSSLGHAPQAGDHWRLLGVLVQSRTTAPRHEQHFMLASLCGTKASDPCPPARSPVGRHPAVLARPRRHRIAGDRLLQRHAQRLWQPAQEAGMGLSTWLLSLGIREVERR